MIDVPFFSLLFNFGMSVKGLALALFKSKMIREGCSTPFALHPVSEGPSQSSRTRPSHSSAARVLNLTQEEQVFDKREDARSGILSWGGKRLRIGHRVGRGKTGPSRSAVAVATIHAHIGTVAVIHGSGKNALMLWRSRPIGPPAPRFGGRLPRRRLCLPPPGEGCPGPAFIFFSC